MRDRVYRTEAVIIRRNDFGEADRLLVVLTPQGKRRVIAKGTRKTTSRLAGHIELFSHVTLLLAVGRTFDIVTQSAVLHHYDQLRGDLERISTAYYVAELIDRLVEENDANPQVFELLTDVMGALNNSDRLDLALRWFELRLLALAGYRPHFFHCAACQETLTEDDNRFSPHMGGMLCRRCVSNDRTSLPISLPTFKLLRFVQTQPIDVLDRTTISPAVRGEAERLLRAYIRRMLERDLKSVAFLDEVRSVG